MTAVIYLSILVALSCFVSIRAVSSGMKREKSPQLDTLMNEISIGKEKQAMQKEGETSLETNLSPADPTNDSGVVGLIANYISKIEERLDNMEQNYASVQDQVSTLNKKILDVEKNGIRCESHWARFSNAKIEITYSRAFKSRPKFIAAFSRFPGKGHIQYASLLATGSTLKIHDYITGTYEVTWMACGN